MDLFFFTTNRHNLKILLTFSQKSLLIIQRKKNPQKPEKELNNVLKKLYPNKRLEITEMKLMQLTRSKFPWHECELLQLPHTHKVKLEYSVTTEQFLQC